MGRKARAGRLRTGRAALLGLLVLLAGCTADNGAAHSDNDKNGGWSHP
jgi:hypothetical protein